MTVFRDVKKTEYIALAEITSSRKVNGEKSLKGTIYTGDETISGIGLGWSLLFDDEIYYVTYALPIDNGDTVTVEFDAIQEFFYWMGKSSVYTELDGSNTSKAYLDLIFTGSGYSYALGTTIAAFEKSNFGMKSRLALFNDFISSTGTEFEVVGQTVTIKDEIGSDLSTIVRKGFNLQELGLEQNIGAFVTYARGFGAYNDPDDPSKGRLEVEYTSPLAEVYGRLEAEPIVDERFTVSANLLEKVKEAVDSSYNISVSLTVEDLQVAGYKYAFPDPGDFILAVNEALGFQQKIRIVGIDESFDVQGNSLSNSVTCNSLNMIEQKNETDASNSNIWSNIANGTKPIPMDWLTDAIRTATTALLNAETEVSFTTNGILAVEKDDSNRIVILNSAGVGISTDGGKTFETAMTADGINASVINTGVLRAITIDGVTVNSSEINGTVINGGSITGSNFLQVPALDENLSIYIHDSEISFYENADDALKDPNNDVISIWGSFGENAAGGGALLIRVGDANAVGGALTLQLYTNRIARLVNVDTFRIVGDLSAINLITTDIHVNGDLTVAGSKNAIHVTRDGVRATPAYEMAESYLGDIGRGVTDENGSVWIQIEQLFSDTVNLDKPYEVFLQVYDDAKVWVSDFRSDAFLVCSDKPQVRFAWELKAKRSGYENVRLEVREYDNKAIEQVWGPEEYREEIGGNE